MTNGDPVDQKHARVSDRRVMCGHNGPKHARVSDKEAEMDPFLEK